MQGFSLEPYNGHAGSPSLGSFLGDGTRKKSATDPLEFLDLNRQISTSPQAGSCQIPYFYLRTSSGLRECAAAARLWQSHRNRVRSHSTQLDPSAKVIGQCAVLPPCRARGTATTVSFFFLSFMLRPRIRQAVSDCVLT